MRKRIILIAILIILAYVGYNYIYQDHRDIAEETADFTLTAKTISNEFSQDVTSSEKKYIDKTLIINGLISEINENSVTLEGVVFCSFLNEIPKSAKEDLDIKIKGRCIGYDDLLQQIKIDQCNILKH